MSEPASPDPIEVDDRHQSAAPGCRSVEHLLDLWRVFRTPVKPASSRPLGGAPLMLAKLTSYTLVGIDAAPVEVEVDVSPSSMPKTVLVGLAEAAVRESTHRVERALVNSGYRRPTDRVIINLAPADLRY